MAMLVPGCTGEGSQAAWNPVTTWPGRVQTKGTCAWQAEPAVQCEGKAGRSTAAAAAAAAAQQRNAAPSPTASVPR